MAKTTNPKFIKEVIELTNKERQRFGLLPLEEDKKLNKAAQGHSKNMALNDFAAHTDPDGLGPSDRVAATGYNYYAGENIAWSYSTPEIAVEGWMDSDGHRANILARGSREIGVGYYFLQNDTGEFNASNYWTQVFGVPSDAPQTKIDNEVWGTDDNERFQGSKDNDRIIGGKGNDTIKGRGGDDYLSASEGNDLLYGAGGNDTVIGNYDLNTLYGGNGDDYLSSWTEQSTIMDGGKGNDYLNSGNGNDILKGGKGKDLIFGNDGDDTIEGGNGTDGLSGNSGNDYLIGGKGNDVLWGDKGSDTLIGVDSKAARPGQKERDILTGGYYGEKDVFVLGDRQKVFYDDGKANNPGKRDYALIRRFDTDYDIIELHGEATDYTIKKSPRGMSSGNAIFLNTSGKDELIAIVERYSWESDIAIDGDYFKFV